jgi:hypothetical protein
MPGGVALDASQTESLKYGEASTFPAEAEDLLETSPAE